jgi:hypothetical protein
VKRSATLAFLALNRAGIFSFLPALAFALVLAVPAAAVSGQRAAVKPQLTEQSTLAQWKSADAESRSKVAVAIARKRLAADATRLEVATAAMEISGCLTATARDARFDAWQVEPTAKTCLEAPERPAKK